MLGRISTMPKAEDQAQEMKIAESLLWTEIKATMAWPVF